MKVTQGTEEALQNAYPGSQDTKGTKANTCGTLDDLCCNPKACDCFPGMVHNQPKPNSSLLSPSIDALCMIRSNTSVTGTGDSTVQMEDGSIKSMAELNLGDKVGASTVLCASYRGASTITCSSTSLRSACHDALSSAQPSCVCRWLPVTAKAV